GRDPPSRRGPGAVRVRPEPGREPSTGAGGVRPGEGGSPAGEGRPEGGTPAVVGGLSGDQRPTPGGGRADRGAPPGRAGEADRAPRRGVQLGWEPAQVTAPRPVAYG